MSSVQKKKDVDQVWFDCYDDIIKIYLKLKCVFMTKLKLGKGLC